MLDGITNSPLLKRFRGWAFEEVTNGLYLSHPFSELAQECGVWVCMEPSSLPQADSFTPRTLGGPDTTNVSRCVT